VAGGLVIIARCKLQSRQVAILKAMSTKLKEKAKPEPVLNRLQQ